MKKTIQNLMLPIVLGLSFSTVTASDEAVRASLQKVFPGVSLDSIKKTPVQGLYEVTAGLRVVYMSEDGRYLIQGDVLDMTTRENLTEPVREARRLASVNKVGENNMIIYKPEKVKHTVTVFTDIDCGYCRKLHSQMDDYLAKGIAIRYLFFPRAGLGSASYDKAVSVWCADDQNSAMTKAKQNQEIETKTCKNPVSDHYDLGRMLGVKGTPAILTDKGELLPGYIPPKKLSGYLEDEG